MNRIPLFSNNKTETIEVTNQQSRERKFCLVVKQNKNVSKPWLNDLTKKKRELHSCTCTVYSTLVHKLMKFAWNAYKVELVLSYETEMSRILKCLFWYIHSNPYNSNLLFWNLILPNSSFRIVNHYIHRWNISSKSAIRSQIET